jgi:hypothetical protein
MAQLLIPDHPSKFEHGAVPVPEKQSLLRWCCRRDCAECFQSNPLNIREVSHAGVTSPRYVRGGHRLTRTMEHNVCRQLLVFHMRYCDPQNL